LVLVEGEGGGWWPFVVIGIVSGSFSLPILSLRDFDGEWFPFSCTIPFDWLFISIDVGFIINVSSHTTDRSIDELCIS